MLTLGSTNDLKLTTSSASAIDWTLSYIISSSTTPFTPDEASGAIASATTTTILAAPAAGITNNVGSAVFKNIGASSNTLTLINYVNPDSFTIFKCTLRTGESLHFRAIESRPFYITSARGARRDRLVRPASATPTLLSGMLHAPRSSISTISVNSLGFWQAVGIVPRDDITSLTVVFKVTTAATSVTWGEVAIALREPNNPTDRGKTTVVGYADIAADITSLGTKVITLNIASEQKIYAGQHIFAGIAAVASGTALVVSSVGSTTDDIRVGAAMIDWSGIRPSTVVGILATTFSMDNPGAQSPAMWVLA